MYILAIAKTEPERALFDMYCSGRSYFWNIFFGWRETKKIGNEEWSYYMVPAQIQILVNAHIIYLKKKGDLK